jgi:hypothetical protein
MATVINETPTEIIWEDGQGNRYRTAKGAYPNLKKSMSFMGTEYPLEKGGPTSLQPYEPEGTRSFTPDIGPSAGQPLGPEEAMAAGFPEQGQKMGYEPPKALAPGETEAIVQQPEGRLVPLGKPPSAPSAPAVDPFLSEQEGLYDKAAEGYEKGATEGAQQAEQIISGGRRELKQRRSDAELAQMDYKMKIDDRLKEMDKAAEDIENSKIGKVTIWTNKNAGQKVGAAIAIAMGAFGDAMMQIGGLKSQGNVPLKILLRQVDQEVDNQKEQLANKRSGFAARLNVLGRLQDQFKNNLLSENILQQNLMKDVDMQLAAAEERKKGTEAGARVAELRRNALQVEWAKALKGTAPTAAQWRMGKSFRELQSAVKEYANLVKVKGYKPSNWIAGAVHAVMPRQLQSGTRQQADVIKSRIATAIAGTLKRGASSKHMIKRIEKEYFPLATDSPQTVSMKQRLLMDTLRNLEAQSSSTMQYQNYGVEYDEDQ